MKHPLFCYLCIFLSLILLACQPKKEKPDVTSFAEHPQTRLNPKYQINSTRIRQWIRDQIREDRGRTPVARSMEEFYRTQPSFLWLGSFRIESQVDSLLAYLEKSSEHGLNPERFRLSDIESDLNKLNRLHLEKGENINLLLARLEYNLTAAYLHYVCGMNFGFVDPRPILNNLEVEEGKDGKPLKPSGGGKVAMKELYSEALQSCDSAFLQAALTAAGKRKADSFLRKSGSSSPSYSRLQAELARLERLSADSFPSIPAIGDTLLECGDRSRVVPLVAERLRITGEWIPEHSGTRSGEILTQELMDAVNLFRKENGLAEDTSLGSLTIRALNLPVAYYTDRLRVNLERLRWKPKLSKGDRYVVVNVASFRLQAVDTRADTVLEMKICVGNKRNKTPLLSSTIRYMELNPYWNVPQSIIIREIIPSFRKDTTYFTRNRFKIYDKEGRAVSPHRIDWSKYREGVPFDVKQDNKDGNSLGRMIFRFPNTHSVYLHDTPAKYGFRLDNRAISHGCVRLEKPLDFAYFLMRERDEKNRDRIRLAVGLPALSEEGRKLTGKKGYKELEYYSFKSSVPLFMEYYTVSVLKDGKIRYENDPYLYDKPLLQALDRRNDHSTERAWILSTKKR